MSHGSVQGSADHSRYKESVDQKKYSAILDITAVEFPQLHLHS